MPGGILCIGAYAERESGNVGFAGSGKILYDAGCIAKAEHQHTGSHWIEGACVPNAARFEELPNPAHHIVRCDSLRLIDAKDSVIVRSLLHRLDMMRSARLLYLTARATEER